MKVIFDSHDAVVGIEHEGFLRGDEYLLFGVALFLGTYNLSRQWYDIARLDTLYLFILVAAAYGLHFVGEPRTMELGLLYRSLAAHQVDIVAGNSTDSAIKALDFVALEDDKHYFPPYEAVPLVREDSLRRWPQIGVAMQRLAGKVSADEMRAMNLAVESQHRDVGDVVREFRAGKGL